MPPIDECPPADKLRLSLDPDSFMPESERETIASHVDGCQRGCKDLIGVLLRGGDVLAGGNAAVHDPNGFDPRAPIAQEVTVTQPCEPEAENSLAFLAPAERPGELGRIAHYRVVKELGRGGMGMVYAAIDTRLERKIALKVMLPKFAANPSAKERFLREARAAAKISHDNVVTVYEADERDGVPYISMQYLQGYPLDEYLKKKGNPSIAQVLRIARETAAGLSAAHQIGLVHRDIKPANLWLEAPNGRVKVLDFGLAKPVDAEVELTKSGAIIGTPAYMSPEQARGEKVDHRTDLFSLGVLLYRISTGRLPFNGPNTMAMLMALGTEEPPPVRSLNPNVPEPLAELIHQLLEKKADARPQSADEVVKRVRAIAKELSEPVAAALAVAQQLVYVPMQITAAIETNPFEDIYATETEPDSMEVEVRPAPVKKKSGTNWLLIASGVVALLSLAIGGYFVFKNKGGADKKDDTVHKEKEGKTPATGKPPIAIVDPDRKAAEYVLSVGGVVRVNGAADDIKSVSALPRSPFALTHVDIATKPAVTDAGLACFKDCKGLTYLDLANTKMTDAGLLNFKDCKDLRELRLVNTKMTDAGLLNFKDCKGLMVLDLSGTPVTDAGLVHLKNFPALASLLLYFSQVTDAGLVHLKNLPALASLWLVNSQVTDAGLVHMKSIPSLTWLGLDNQPVSDKGLAALKECRGLTSLGLTNTKVTPQGLSDFHAALPGCRVDYTGGIIDPVDVDRKAAEWVLSVGGAISTPFTEIKDAANLPKERFLLQSVILGATAKATTPASEYLKHCKGLTWLLLHGSDWTEVRQQEFKGLTGLTVLQLWYVPATGLGAFKDCEDLKGLTLNFSDFSDAGLEQVAGFKKLTHLEIVNTKVTDKGLAHLKGLKSLVFLKVGGTMVTAKALAEFHEAVPGCKIDKDGVIIEPKK